MPPDPVPEPLERFVELVNGGAYWESHEVLEGPWRQGGSDFFQGLILYASAFVHAKRGNRHGIEAQLSKAEKKLASYPDAYLGVDLAAIRSHIRRCGEVLKEHPQREPRALPELIPFPVLELRVEHVRGDEPELRATGGEPGG